MNGILLGLCVLITKGPLTGTTGTAVEYKDSVYMVEYTKVNKELDIPFLLRIQIHESNLGECK